MTRKYLEWINGLHKRLNSRVWELKIDFGPGYRVYYADIRNELIVLLAGGDKSSQKQDLRVATAMANQLDTTHP